MPQGSAIPVKLLHHWNPLHTWSWAPMWCHCLFQREYPHSSTVTPSSCPHPAMPPSNQFRHYWRSRVTPIFGWVQSGISSNQLWSCWSAVPRPLTSHLVMLNSFFTFCRCLVKDSQKEGCMRDFCRTAFMAFLLSLVLVIAVGEEVSSRICTSNVWCLISLVLSIAVRRQAVAVESSQSS